MGIRAYLYDFPYYTGIGGISAQVPAVYTISLNGRNYMVDMDQPFYRQYKRQMAEILRQQADTQPIPGEQSLNPEDLWRRSQEDWSEGAGQRYLDRHDSLSNRFWQSKGIDVWSKWQISLLPDTRQIRSSGNTNLLFETAGQNLYVTDGQTLAFTTDVTVGSPTFTTVTGTPANTASSITSDGNNVYVTYAAGGIWTTTRGAATATQFSTSALTSNAVIAFLKGRLMLSNNNSIYNLTGSGALPSALFTHGNTDFKWVGFAEGINQIYCAGFSGDKSWIYRIAVLTDGTALSPPVVACELPDGEQVTAIFGYAGFIMIGTTLGVRIATITSTGDLTIASLIPTGGNSVFAFEGNTATRANGLPNGGFVWFGWSNYDTSSTGLGRLDLQNFAIPDTQPAYASDLMVTGQGQVNSVQTMQNLRVIAVNSLGFYVQHTNLVSTGFLDSGYILYNLPDTKISTVLMVQTPGALSFGSYSEALAVDAGSFSPVGTHSVGQFEPVNWSTNQLAGGRFELRTTLNRDTTTTTAGPTISRYTLRVWPAPKRPLNWQIPLILNENVVTASSTQDPFDPQTELAAIENMVQQGQLVIYQEGQLSYPVFVSDVQFIPTYTTEDKRFFNGVAIVQLKGIPPT